MADSHRAGPGAIRVRPGHHRAQRRPHGRGAARRWSSSTPATGRSRSARTSTSPTVNAALDFDREAADGFRLDIPSGTSRRFEPGASREVAIVALRGRRRGARHPGQGGGADG